MLALLSSGHREQNTMMSRSFVGIHGENLGKLGVRSRDVGKKEKPQSSTSEVGAQGSSIVYYGQDLENFSLMLSC